MWPLSNIYFTQQLLETLCLYTDFFQVLVITFLFTSKAISSHCEPVSQYNVK